MQIESSEYKLQPEGTHTAVLYQIIDMGTQQNDFAGDIKRARTAWINFELSHELMEDGRPYSIGKQYGLKSHPKSGFSGLVKALKGVAVDKNLDFKSLLASACNLTIEHAEKDDGSMKSKIVAITALKKGEVAPAPYNACQIFDLDAFDQDQYNALPDWLRERIALSPEYRFVMSHGGKNPPPIVRPSDTVSAPPTPPVSAYQQDLNDDLPANMAR